MESPTLCQVKVAEFGIDWALKVAPMDGWPAVSDDFWRQLLLLGKSICVQRLCVLIVFFQCFCALDFDNLYVWGTKFEGFLWQDSTCPQVGSAHDRPFGWFLGCGYHLVFATPRLEASGNCQVSRASKKGGYSRCCQQFECASVSWQRDEWVF